jgi:ankyrin repeat protein
MNGKDQLGYTGLIIALFCKNKVATEELLTHSRTRVDGTEESVDVNIRNNDDETVLHWASAWPNIPEKLFQKILDAVPQISKRKTAAELLLWISQLNINR